MGPRRKAHFGGMSHAKRLLWDPQRDPREAPLKYMKKSKLLILTSVYEGFPNVLVESLTIGTPVISTNANAGASEILLNGKGGDLIRIGDYKNLAKKIIRHFSYPKILIKKAKIAKKNLYRFETKRHSKIYTNLFQRI